MLFHITKLAKKISDELSGEQRMLETGDFYIYVGITTFLKSKIHDIDSSNFIISVIFNHENYF